MRRIACVAATLMALTLLPAAQARAGTVGAQPVATGLDFPAGFTFAPNGRIFYGERFSGEIRIYTPSTGMNSLFVTVPNLVSNGEQGLLGLAVHPNYPTKPFVYAFATRNTQAGLRNQILRWKYVSGKGRRMTVIFESDVTPATIHNGGRILFGPDKRLYAIIGDAANPSNSQNLSVRAGKVLRMTAGGAVPADNPFPGTYVFTYGHRNSFGFTFDPANGRLWETENGPSCNDEINRVVAGGNYGWGPSQDCSDTPAPQNTNRDGPNPILPEAFFTPTVAPVGTAFCSGCGLSGSEGTLFFGNYNTGQIRRAVLSADRQDIDSITTQYTHSAGILSMERGVDGALYFSTSVGIYKLVPTT